MVHYPDEIEYSERYQEHIRRGFPVRLSARPVQGKIASPALPRTTDTSTDT